MEARLSTTLQTGPETHSASNTVGIGSLPEIKQWRHGIDHPPTSSTKVEERVDCTSTPPLSLHGLS